MEWSLVLASQDIETAIEKDDAGWSLSVADADYNRAVAAIELYRRENRGWLWRRRLAGTELSFHWASVVWVFAIAAFFLWAGFSSPSVTARGLMDSKAVAAGQWWRLFTAITLHADGPHLIANATTGFLFFGFAMSRYGPGLMLLAAYLAGAAANLAGYWVYPMSHRGLGASGMVMGGLGLLAVHSAALWRLHPKATGILLRTAAGGFLILVFFGFSPDSDVLAHVAGFLFGLIFGSCLNLLPISALRSSSVNRAAILILVACALGTWRLALR